MYSKCLPCKIHRTYIPYRCKGNTFAPMHEIHLLQSSILYLMHIPKRPRSLFSDVALLISKIFQHSSIATRSCQMTIIEIVQTQVDLNKRQKSFICPGHAFPGKYDSCFTSIFSMLWHGATVGQYIRSMTSESQKTVVQRKANRARPRKLKIKPLYNRPPVKRKPTHPILYATNSQFYCNAPYW